VNFQNISIVLPAKNEALNLERLLPQLVAACPGAEIIVVDDGSTDNTQAIIQDNNVSTVRHPYSKGNGASIKSGARQATGDIIVFMDGDGQHRPTDIARLLEKLSEGYDLVVGARSSKSQASIARGWANGLYNTLASWMTGFHILDLTSGFRAVKADKFRRFLYMLPNGFSYPTTSTMAFFRAGYSVGYVPIETDSRLGKSHINLLKDGIRFLLIIFKIGTLYAPMRIFFPIALTHFVTGLCYYLYTFITMSRFTNMSALLFTSAIVIFMIGLVSEQVTVLLYQDSQEK